jgi:hypothetical protein
MKDIMAQRDGVALSLECGHPNVQPGETCPLCGKNLLLEAINIASSAYEAAPDSMYVGVPGVGCVHLSKGKQPMLIVDEEHCRELTEEELKMTDKFFEGKDQ